MMTLSAMSLSMFATSKSESSLELLSADEVSPELPLEDEVELLEDVSVEELLELEEVVLVLELLLELLDELDPELMIASLIAVAGLLEQVSCPTASTAETTVLAINAKSNFLVKKAFSLLLCSP